MKIYKDKEIYQIIDKVSALYDDIYKDEIQKPHSLKKRIENSILSDRQTILVTEEYKEQLVGFLFGFDFRKENWWAQQVDRVLPKETDWYQHSFELNELCIDKDYRRQGIGYQLMNYLATTDFDYLLLSVRVQNTPALSLYKKLGYQVLHEHFQFDAGETLFHIMYKENEDTRA